MEGERKPTAAGYSGAPPPIFAPAVEQPHWHPYPYQPAPPSYYPPPPPIYGPPPSSNVDGRRSAIRRLILFFVCVFLAFGLVTLIMLMVLHPTLPLVSVSSASVSSFNVSGGQQFSANFNVTFSIRNPNTKMSISYEEIQASILFQSETLSETSLPPFYQEEENSTLVPASFRSVSKYVEVHTSDGITRSRASNGGIVDFEAAFIAWIRYRSGAWETRRHLLRVVCNNVKIRLSNSALADGTLMGDPLPCHVYL